MMNFKVWSRVFLSLMIMLSAGAVFFAESTRAASVVPTTVPGNATCPAGTTELKVEPVSDGTFSDGTLTVTVDVRDTADGQVFDFTSNIGVVTVIAKGSPSGNVYTYNPPVTADTGLHAPLNPSNGSFYGLSHISFCYPPVLAETETPVPTNTPT